VSHQSTTGQLFTTDTGAVKGVVMATNTVNTQEGYIWGLSVDFLLNWTNVVYLVALAITVVASVAVWRLSALSGAAKDRQLATYQADAKVQIADAQKAASDAAKRAVCG
jgi:hypothetical protein